MRAGDSGRAGPQTNATTVGSNSWFDTTHWSAVLSAAGQSVQGHEALSRLCQTYWYPLYSYVRRSGHTPEDAQDLTQEFFARLLQHDYLKAADPEKGRFRSFLLIVLKRFMANEWDKAHRIKRGGGNEISSLDAQDTEGRYLCEPADQFSPEKMYDRNCAMALLGEVMMRLEAEFETEAEKALFQELRPMLSGDDEGFSYRDVSGRVGMTEVALRQRVRRLRQRYRELLRLEIANTVVSPDSVDDEIRDLFSALS
jgi:RNA polymerase sigma-70 factor (ECF subfamily)